MDVKVLSRAAVENGAAEGADAVISIRPSAPERCESLDLAVQQAVLGNVDAILTLHFDDVAVPVYGPFQGPTMGDVVAALDFARVARERAPDGVLAVHCQYGRSRSTAIALAVLADALGVGQEEEAVAALLYQDVDGQMHPNPRLVSLADAALYRYGRLDAALAAASPRYMRWRDHWRDVSLDPERYWRQAKKVRVKRKNGAT